MDNYNLQQTDAKIQAILNKVQPVVDNNTVAGFGNGYAICATAGATADKEVTINGFTPTIGGVFSVMFQNAFSASDPTLNVSNTGAKDLMLFGSALPAAFVPAGTILTLIYDGTNYNVIGRLNDITVKSTLESTDSPLLQDANGNFIKSTPAALASLLGVGEVEYTIAPNETIFLNYGEGAIVGIKRKGTSSLAVLVSIRFRSIEVICDSQNNYLSLISNETGLNITNISSSSIIIVCKRVL